MRNAPARRGATLTELMVATVLLSVGILGLFSSFRFIGRSLHYSRTSSLATNLAQERIESLKNLNYYALMITTNAASDSNFSPAIPYDSVNYPPETISIGGISYTRYTYVSMAEINNGAITEVSATYPDTGLKEIVVSVTWQDNGTYKKWQLRNLLENPNVNPLDASLTGYVKTPLNQPIASANVEVEQNSDWSTQTDVNGQFTFSVYHGTYTVRASSQGYSPAVSASLVVNRGSTGNVGTITLTPIATGFIVGNAWYNSDLVISQVVAATNTVVGDGNSHDIEYVELFNPTTFAINIGVTANAYPKPMGLLYYDYDGSNYMYDGPPGWYPGHNFDMVVVTTWVAPNHYYLIANASYFYINGGWVTADEYYDSTLSYPNYIHNSRAAGVGLYRWATFSYPDTVGWNDTNGHTPVWLYEWPYISFSGVTSLGSPKGQQLVRVSSPSASFDLTRNAFYGRAYDSNENRYDFYWDGQIPDIGKFVTPRTTASSTFTVTAGKPAIGAYVSASDSNSGSTQTYTAYITSGAYSLPYAHFQLPGVSTGSWTVNFALNGYTASYDSATVSQGVYTGVPNSATYPTWASVNNQYQVLMTTSAVLGYVKGTVYDLNNHPLSGISVQGGGSSKTTGSNGAYFMQATTGTVSVIANPNNANSQYQQDVEVVTVTQGNITTQDYTLSYAASLTGYVTTGTTPLPNQAIAIYDASGAQYAGATTNSSGNFTVRNISTATANYTVAPILETGQDSSPNSISVPLTSTGTVFVGTFTVNGAYGNITGTVSDASGLITSGALVLASTASIASSPSAIVGSSAPAQSPMYMVSSKADGTYTLPVRGGNTYYLSVYVPVISNAGTVSITTKTYSSIAVSASGTVTRNISVP